MSSPATTSAVLPLAIWCTVALVRTWSLAVVRLQFTVGSSASGKVATLPNPLRQGREAVGGYGGRAEDVEVEDL